MLVLTGTIQLKKDNTLLTGLRLLGILSILFEKDSTKSELRDLLKKKFDIQNYSLETIKLDLNTLIRAGFKIARGSPSNAYKISLEKDFSIFNLTKRDFIILNTAKEAVLGLCNYKEILNTKVFYKKIAKYADKKYADFLLDFKFYNMVNEELVENIEKAIIKAKSCILVYDSPARGKIELRLVPVEIFSVDKKLYLKGLSHEGKVILRIDKIKAFNEIADDYTGILDAPSEKNIKYCISRNFFENNPLEPYEKVKKKTDSQVFIETDKDLFFVIQRLMMIGKECIKIPSKAVRNEVMRHLEKILEKYN